MGDRPYYVDRGTMRALQRLLTTAFSLGVCASSLMGPICHAAASNASAEMQINEAIVLFEDGSYGAALTLFSSLADDSEVALKYVDLCEHRIGSNRTVSVNNSSNDFASRADCGDAIHCGSQCQAKPKPWHLTLLTGYQYDSNVTLEPQFAGLRQRSRYRGFQCIRGGLWRLSGGTAVYLERGLDWLGLL